MVRGPLNEDAKIEGTGIVKVNDSMEGPGAQYLSALIAHLNSE